MIVLALTDIKLLLRYAYVFYFITLILLVVVEVAGHTGMGATRWINLGFIKLQPSEFMKIAMVLVLARYFIRRRCRVLKACAALFRRC